MPTPKKLKNLRCRRNRLQKGDKYKALLALQFAALNPGALRVASALIWHTNAETGRCDPSISRLAKETDLSERQVYRAINELETAKLMQRIRHAGHAYCNAYNLRWDELRERYQKWLVDNGLAALTPDTDVISNLSQVTKTDDTHVTQTREEPEKITGEERRSSSAPSRKRADASRPSGFDAGRDLGAIAPLGMTQIPLTRSNAHVAREKAHERLNDDLLKNLSPEAYEDFIDALDEKTTDLAIAAEIKKPRTQAGLRAALGAVGKQKPSPAQMPAKVQTPKISEKVHIKDDYPEMPAFLRRCAADVSGKHL